jgi:6-pyruvoyltetrahydropterin/6-carboxytetrahydropterin synthase
MYLVRIERTFSAAHSIVMGGVPEPVHGHDWRVAATFAGAGLDADGLLVDFHAVERALNRSLNAVPPFDRLNPTAELVARHIADELGGAVPAGVRVHAVSVGEAPGCTATYLGACAGAGE